MGVPSIGVGRREGRIAGIAAVSVRNLLAILFFGHSVAVTNHTVFAVATDEGEQNSAEHQNTESKEHRCQPLRGKGERAKTTIGGWLRSSEIVTEINFYRRKIILLTEIFA